MTENSNQQWQHLPLFALLFFFGRALYQLIRNAMNMAPALAGALLFSETVRAWAFTLVPIAIVLIVIVGGALHYWYFRYCVGEQTIYIRQGVFNRVQLALEYPRIQQAEIDQPFYFRPFNLAILTLDSAGSSANEVKLAGLPIATATAMKHDMLQARRAEQNLTGTETADASAEASLNSNILLELETPVHEVLKFGVMDSRTLLSIPFIIALLFQFDRSIGVIQEWVITVTDQLSAYVVSSWLWVVLAVAAIALVLMGSMGFALVRFFGFKLTVDDEKYQAESGLVSKRSLTIRQEKLQLVRIKQNFAARWLNRYSILIKQLQPRATTGGVSSFTIPVLTTAQRQQLTDIFSLPGANWQRVSPASVLLPTLFWLAVLLTIAGFSVTGTLPTAITMVAIGIVIPLISWRRWYCFGLHWDNQWLAVRTGFIGAQQSWYPMHKLQKVTSSEPPWLRWFGMASVTVYTAAGAEQVSWLKKSQAEQVQRDIISAVSSHRGSWM